MKAYQVLIVMMIMLVQGLAAAGESADQAGATASSGLEQAPGTVPVEDLPEDDGFAADIFQDDQTGQDSHTLVADPLEQFNRAVFVFNDKLYVYGLRPLTKGYARVCSHRCP